MNDAVLLTIGIAPAARRPALAALFALDARLGSILRSTSEALIGQMRLTWWREALVALDDAPAPAEPILADLARHALPAGITGADLAAMVDGWEALAAAAHPIDADVMLAFARARGGVLFRLAARSLSGTVPDGAGEGWALIDLAANLLDAKEVAVARSLASRTLAEASGRRWSRPVRPLGLLMLMMLSDRRGRPATALNLVRFRLTGRLTLEIG